MHPLSDYIWVVTWRKLRQDMRGKCINSVLSRPRTLALWTCSICCPSACAVPLELITIPLTHLGYLWVPSYQAWQTSYKSYQVWSPLWLQSQLHLHQRNADRCPLDSLALQPGEQMELCWKNPPNMISWRVRKGLQTIKQLIFHCSWITSSCLAMLTPGSNWWRGEGAVAAVQHLQYLHYITGI